MPVFLIPTPGRAVNSALHHAAGLVCHILIYVYVGNEPSIWLEASVCLKKRMTVFNKGLGIQSGNRMADSLL